MAAGDINDALSDIPGITLRDNTDDPTDQGAGFALLKFKNGKLVWLPNTGAVRYALDTSSVSQLAGLTAEAAPADGDLILMERASDGAKRKVLWENLPGAGTGGGGASSLLAYSLAADTWDNTTLTGGAWADACANQTFTPASATSVVLVLVRGQGQIKKGSANSGPVAARAVIDSGGTPAYSKLQAGDYDNGDFRAFTLSGAIALTGLSAAAHTVKVQLKPPSDGTAYLRASSNPDPEFLAIAVLELKA